MNRSTAQRHAGFLRGSMVYIALNFTYSLTELVFNGVAARLPEGTYATFWALLRIFFIITTPLVALQLVVSKEVAAYSVLGQFGRRRYFITRTFRYAVTVAAAILVAGILFSPVIRAFLRIGDLLPVMLVFASSFVYFPIPILYGVVQGLKKFYSLGLLQISWGAFRILFGIAVIVFFGGNLGLFIGAVIVGTVCTDIIGIRLISEIFDSAPEPVERETLLRAYRFMVPVVAALLGVMILKNIDMVFAERYFDDVRADAYACAVLVGSAFFTLSGIIMVMFPMVSEEKAVGGNPIMLLLKSMGFITVLSLAGIVVAFFRPDIPMYIITFGVAKPGAEILIRYIGCAILPLSLVYVITNYFLAQHQWRFIFILAAGVMVQVGLLSLHHETPMAILQSVTIANYLTFAGMMIYLWRDHGSFTP